MSLIIREYSRAPFGVKLTFLAAGLATFFLLSLAVVRPMDIAPPMPSGQTRPGSIVHVVMFQYAPATPPAEKAEVATAFLALKDTCRRPGGRKYILSIDGGPNISTEKAGKSMEHAYVVTFKNAADRDYYVQEDPAHVSFKASLGDKVQDVLVFDFESGQFQKQGQAQRPRRSDDLHVRTV